MKYSVSNTIDKPLDEVIEKFLDPEGVKHWMEGFQKMEHISGDKGEVGGVTDLYFIVRKKEMVIQETILEKNLPNQMKFAYQSPMAYNEVEMTFEPKADGSVLQTNTSYFRFKGLMKIMGWLATGAFKKQSLKYMNAFKDFVENGPKD